MTENEALALFVVLAGYWPNTAPDPDDPVALAAHRDILEDFAPEAIRDALRHIAIEGREFCPPPGVIAAAVGAKVPPYFEPYVPELPEAPPATADQVAAAVAEARAALRGSVPSSGSPKGAQ